MAAAPSEQNAGAGSSSRPNAGAVETHDPREWLGVASLRRLVKRQARPAQRTSRSERFEEHVAVGREEAVDVHADVRVRVRYRTLQVD